MTITYANGQKMTAALVVRTDNRIRVVLEGQDDITEFTQIGSAWVSEDCEPVQIEFGSQKRSALAYEEEDLVCSKDLAARLIHLLRNPAEDEELSVSPMAKPLNSVPAQWVM
jgi:hypothetical protein